MPQAVKPPVALDAVFRSDYRWLTDKLRRSLGDPYVAEDIASESFTQLAALPSLDAVREPRAMLTTIANRIVYDIYRRRDLERGYLQALSALSEPLWPSPEALHALTQSLAAVDRTLDSLSENARSAFLQSRFDGVSYAEIAAHLNVSVSMVRQYVAAAQKQCRLAVQAETAQASPEHWPD